MNQDTENFEKLRHLLALKRHEQPPPRYFNDFSSHVIARIKSGDRGEATDVVARLLWEAPWLQRVWAVFESKPILAGVCGVAACGLLLTGMIYSDKADPATVALVPAGQGESAPMELATVSPVNHPLVAKPALIEPSSTNPIGAPQSDGSLLGDISGLRAQPASFNFPSGN